jgi:cell division protein FtsQ
MSAPTVESAAPVVTDLRVGRPRRRRLLRLLLVVVVAALTAVTVWAVWFSSLLAVREVRAVGVEGARANAVLTAAAVPVGEPLARVDTGRAERAVLALDWVSDVEVRRGWPTEVVVAVTAREPVALLAAGSAPATEGAGRQAVDATGVVFEAVGSTRGLPRVSAEGPALAEAMAVLASLPRDLARKVVSVSASTRDDVDLTLRSGDIVRWGSAERGEFKAEVLRALLTRKADVYDVSAPELPTTFRAR